MLSDCPESLKVLVTGTTGFIGGHTVPRLIEKIRRERAKLKEKRATQPPSAKKGREC